MSNFSKQMMMLIALCATPITAHTQQPAPAAPQVAKTVDPATLAPADQLLALAQKLKESIDKTQKYELSVTALKQADEIEKLAKSTKEHIK